MTNINEIHIKFIPASEFRYETVGDYWIEGETLQIRVVKMNDTIHNCLVAVHEFVEWMMTDYRGLAEEDIMAFDKEFEKENDAGVHHDTVEPGFDSRSPYLREHTFATSVEMMICGFLGISWTNYDKIVMEQ